MKPTASELRALARRDPALGQWLRELAPFPRFPDASSRRHRTHYVALASAIVYQQLAGKAAATIHARVCALTPGPHFPEPDEMLALYDVELRRAGLSRNKIAALRDLSQRVHEGRLRLDRIARKRDEAVIEELVEVRGIGVWSAQMFLLFRLGRLDVMPAGDLGVREGVRILDGLRERPDEEVVLERAEAWRPLRSVATWYLWRGVERARAAAKQ